KAVDTPIETAIGAQRRVVHDDQHVAAAHRGVGAGGDQRGELVVADASGGDPGHDGNARGVEADDGVLLAEEANHGPGPLHLVAGQVGVEEVAEPLLEAALAHAAGCEDVVVAGDDGEAVGPIGQRSERLAHALEFLVHGERGQVAGEDDVVVAPDLGLPKEGGEGLGRFPKASGSSGELQLDLGDDAAPADGGPDGVFVVDLNVDVRDVEDPQGTDLPGQVIGYDAVGRASSAGRPST